MVAWVNISTASTYLKGLKYLRETSFGIKAEQITAINPKFPWQDIHIIVPHSHNGAEKSFLMKVPL